MKTEQEDRDPDIALHAWEKADNNNPDRSRYNTVCELGSKALKDRREKLMRDIKDDTKNIDDLYDCIKKVERQTISTDQKLGELNSRQKKLKRKLLSIMQKVEVLRCHKLAHAHTIPQHVLESGERRWHLFIFYYVYRHLNLIDENQK